MSKIRKMLDECASGYSIEKKSINSGFGTTKKRITCQKGSTVQKTLKLKKATLNAWSITWK